MQHLLLLLLLVLSLLAASSVLGVRIIVPGQEAGSADLPGADPTLVGVYYMEEGNFSYYAAYQATIDVTTGNMTTVRLLDDVDNNDRSPGAYDPARQTYYWTFCQPRSGTSLYVSQPNTRRPTTYFISRYCVQSMQRDPRSGLLFAATTLNNNNPTVPVIAIDPLANVTTGLVNVTSSTQCFLSLTPGAAFDTANGVFAFLSCNAQAKETLYQYYVHTGRLQSVPLNCQLDSQPAVLTAIHYDPFNQRYLAIMSRTTYSRISLVQVDQQSGTCKILLKDFVQGRMEWSAFDPTTGLLAILEDRTSIALVDTRRGNTISIVHLPNTYLQGFAGLVFM